MGPRAVWGENRIKKSRETVPLTTGTYIELLSMRIDIKLHNSDLQRLKFSSKFYNICLKT